MSRRVRYLLEKRPNLLSCTLLLPLLGSDRDDAEARSLAKTIGVATRDGGQIKPTSNVTGNVPYLRITLSDDKRRSTVKVVARYAGEKELKEYISVEVDCPLDIDRSILTVQGDHLAARLAFGDYSSARDTKLGKF